MSRVKTFSHSETTPDIMGGPARSRSWECVRRSDYDEVKAENVRLKNALDAEVRAHLKAMNRNRTAETVQPDEAGSLTTR